MNTLIFMIGIIGLIVYVRLGPEKIKSLQQQAIEKKKLRKERREERRRAFIQKNYDQLTSGGHNPDDYERLSGYKK